VTAPHGPRPAALAVLSGLAGAVVAAILGLLTFGAQASARPDHVPLGLALPNQGPAAEALRSVPGQLTAQLGDAVAWRVTGPDEAAKALDAKETYGYLDLTQFPGVRIVVSGATNAQGAQFAQQILTEVAHRLAAASPGAPRLETIQVHPASVAGRVAPLAASALLWITGLVATVGFGALAARRGTPAGIGPRALLGLTATVLGTAVVVGYFRLWDETLPLNGNVIGFLLLTGLAFTAVQGALVRLVGIRAAALLGPLYLIAPAVAGQVPEGLNPAYRAALWSWTPFRFSTEGLRSLLQGTPAASDVRTGVIVLGAMAVAGLTVLVLTALSRSGSPSGEEAQPNPANGVVPVGVDQADGLPGTERQLPAEHGNGGVRR
jgi:hypothetical protein